MISIEIETSNIPRKLVRNAKPLEADAMAASIDKGIRSSFFRMVMIFSLASEHSSQ